MGQKSWVLAQVNLQRQITLNPETNEIFLDINTASIIPSLPAAGYIKGSVADYDSLSFIKRIAGFGTGDFYLDVLDPRAIEDTNTFQITFDASPTRYSIEDLKPVIETRISKTNVFITLKEKQSESKSFYIKR